MRAHTIWTLAFLVLLEFTEAQPNGRKADVLAKERRQDQEEKGAQEMVTSDRDRLEEAIKNLGEAVKDQENDAKGKQHAISLAEDAQFKATAAQKGNTQQATDAFNKALSALKNATATGKWEDVERRERSVRQHAKELDKLQDAEEKDARERLRNLRKAQSDKVRQSYREARKAARKLLRDRDRLERAQRRTGANETVYEKEEMKNEFLAEDLEDLADRQKDRAYNAHQQIFEHAEDHLHEIQHTRRKNYEMAAHQRHHAIDEVVERLRRERREARDARKQRADTAHTDGGELPAIVDLLEAPEHTEHLNATQKKALKHEEVEHLRQASENGIKKANDLIKSLKQSLADEVGINDTAAQPAKSVASAFGKRNEALKKDIKSLQEQANSKNFKANFTLNLRQTRKEVEALRDDEFHALHQARHETYRAVRKTADSWQAEVRHEARQVWSLSDHMARKDRSYQDLADQLQNKVEAAADAVENHADEYTRRTQDRLEDQVSVARGNIREEAHRRFQALHAMEVKFKSKEVDFKFNNQSHFEIFSKKSSSIEHPIPYLVKVIASSSKFLAERSDGVNSNPSPLAGLALVGAAFACATFFVKRHARTIEAPMHMLG